MPIGTVTAAWSVIGKRAIVLAMTYGGVMLSIILLIILILSQVLLIICTYRLKQYVSSFGTV